MHLELAYESLSIKKKIIENIANNLIFKNIVYKLQMFMIFYIIGLYCSSPSQKWGNL